MILVAFKQTTHVSCSSTSSSHIGFGKASFMGGIGEVLGSWWLVGFEFGFEQNYRKLGLCRRFWRGWCWSWTPV